MYFEGLIQYAPKTLSLMGHCVDAVALNEHVSYLDAFIHRAQKMLIVRPDRRSNAFRLKRFSLVRSIINEILSKSSLCRILDVGGTPEYWEAFGDDLDWERIELISINREPSSRKSQKIRNESGDARSIPYCDNAFDFVHSNSVIEHVGRWPDMLAMSREVRRLAPRYYVQTPYQWFFMEPHAVFPFFHWMPESIRYRLVMKRQCGFWPKQADLDGAMATIQSAVLLDRRQMAHLFPDAKLVSEKFLGMTKSLIAIR